MAAPRDVPGAPPARVPSVIAGHPTEVVAYELGGLNVALVCVQDLEARLDRQRLLCDEAYEPPYWALVWTGARLLARHVVEAVDCEGKTVLDVGCGLGLTSVAAARRGALVTAIDRDLAATEFLLASAAANRVRVEALVGDVTAVRLPRRYDIVLAAEILYDFAAFDRLGAALAGALAPGGSVWLADAGRVNTRAFYAGLERRGLAIREVAVREDREEGTPVRIRLLELRRASAVTRS
jgi:predicted nicotinamide N-methyase